MTTATIAQPSAEAQEAPAASVPDRPRLAPGVELRGEMSDSAFKDPPWLIERDGSYLRVSKLLYAVAEQANGQRTLEEMAEAVSHAVQRQASADDIAYIVAGLIRSGIVLDADGKVAPHAAAPSSASISPLSVNMRMALLSPRVIGPVTAVLRVLFWPPVLFLILAAAAVAQGWMYLVHGIGGGLHDALYTPGLAVLVLVAIVLAAGFHEFGHASALRYGGGRVGRMGAGFYLFYPAFYTDVTDNYRLGRWARIRTDLGGFYFNLIFALGLMALYVATGWEILLLIVVMINIEIIHQLMPFVRLDGYWALADLTGIPDFFSHVGPFLRSILPLKFWKGERLPELKLWARIVFVLYLLVTIPLLLFLLVLLVGAVPRIIATAWDSFWVQWAELQTALERSDAVTIGGTIVQMLVLALMTIGLCFFLLTLARTATVKMWNWSKPSWPRRLAGATVAVAGAGLLMVLFLPPTPLTGNRGGALSDAIRFEPIAEGESLTIDKLSGGEDRGAPGGSNAPGASPAPGTNATASPGATVAPTAAPSSTAGSGTAAPAAGPTPAPGASQTPAAGSATPTPAATATSAPSPTPNPSPSASASTTP